MKLGLQNFVPVNPLNAGQEMYTALMAPGTPVPAKYMHVTAPSVPMHTAVPLAEAANFHPVPGVPHPVPNQEQTFLAARKTLQDRVDKQAICVYQRGYAITDSSSPTPLLCTMSIAPCIVVIVRNPSMTQAALTHVDAYMNTASIATVVNEFASGAPLDLYFHGGLPGVAESQTTCEGLLQALYALEGATQRFAVREFDVLDRPHGTALTFDTANAVVYPGFAAPAIRFDSAFRTLTNGTYLIGGAAAMAQTCELMAASTDATKAAAGVAARDIRKQFDGRPSKYNAFLKTVEDAVFAAVAVAAVQRAGKGAVQDVKDSVTAVLHPENVVELAERNLKRYLSDDGTSKAGDKTYLIEALISALIWDEDLKTTTKTWLAKARN